MGKSLSWGIRERVVSLVDAGFSRHEAARRRRISAASAVRIMQRKTRTGGVKAAPQGRPRRSRLDRVSGWLSSRVAAEPDITMSALAKTLKTAHDLAATPGRISRHLLHRLGFTCKNIADRDGAAAQAGSRRQLRVAAPAGVH